MGCDGHFVSLGWCQFVTVLKNGGVEEILKMPFGSRSGLFLERNVLGAPAPLNTRSLDFARDDNWEEMTMLQSKRWELRKRRREAGAGPPCFHFLVSPLGK
jgi:hypothetical protein